jgi:hypothetical protein
MADFQAITITETPQSPAGGVRARVVVMAWRSGRRHGKHPRNRQERRITPQVAPEMRLFCWMCGWFRSALRSAVSVRAPSPPHPAWARRGLSTASRRWSTGVCLGSVTHLDRQATLPPTPIGPAGKRAWPRVRDAGGSWARGYRPRGAPGSVRVEGFLPVWGGVSSPIGLKPSTHPDTDPTDQVTDDCVSPGRPADREHVPAEKSAVPRPHPPAVPPPAPAHQSEEPVIPSDHPTHRPAEPHFRAPPPTWWVAPSESDRATHQLRGQPALVTDLWVV